MKANYYKIVAALCILQPSLFLFSCSQDEDVFATENTLRFNIYDAGTTRAVTDGSAMVTTFELSDRAGVYAVKDGQLVLQNVPLTYNVSGFWQSATPIDATELQGATFYAYYPYSETAVFDSKSSTPFAAMVAATEVPAKQGTKAAYEAADIMVTTGCTIGQYNAVALPLRHQKAMICVELPNSSYIFTQVGMEPYVMAKAENAKFTLDQTSVTPYFDSGSQSYRLIVEPGQASNLQVEFSNLGTSRSYTAQNLSQMAAGQYAKFVVDGGARLTTMTLKTGDYFCSDGTLISSDAANADLSKVIGVVVKTGTTDAIASANASCTHGIVVALDQVKAKWGNDKSTTSEQNAAGWRYWFKDYGLSDQNNTTSSAKLDETTMSEQGFETTMTWLNVPEPLTIGGITLDYTSLMRSTYNAFVEQHPLPYGITTCWYIPSLKDCQNIEAVLETLNERITAAGGTAIGAEQMWSCNVRAAGSNWCYVMGKTALADRYKGVACNGSAQYRFLMAF